MNKSLRDLIDLEKVSKLLEGFNKSSGFVTAILDLEGNVLSKSGWRQICTEFHRVHPKTSERCTYSDTVLAGKMETGGGYYAYTCLNGLTDVAVPIVINGQHVGNLFSGSFLLEEPDIDFFKKQANKFGFDEKEYMKALSEVPVISEEKVKTVMDFLLQMTNLISELGVEKTEQVELNKRLRESENGLQAANQQLRATEQQLRVANQQLITSEQELKKEKRFSKKIVETADAIIVGLDKDHIIRIFNQGAENITGYKKDEVIGKDWFKIFFPKEMLDEMNKVWEKSWGVKSHSYINPILAKSGEERIISWQTTGMYDSDDVSKHLILSIGEDITERKQAEEALRASEEKFRKAFSTSPDAMNINRLADGRYVDINEGFTAITGFSREDVIGKTSREINIWADSTDRERLINQLKRSGVVNNMEAVFRAKDGRLITGLMSARVIELSGEKHILSITRDIEEITQVQLKLHESEAKYRSVLEEMQESYYEVDIAGNLTFFNDSLCRLLGYPGEELMNMNDRSYTDAENAKKLYQAFNKVYRTGDPTMGFDWEIIRKDGVKRTIEASVSLRKDSSNVSTGFQGVIRDITNEKLTEQMLRESEERFRSIYENASIGLYRTTPDGRILMANPALVGMMGYSSFEELSRVNIESTPSHFPENPRSRFKEMLEQHNRIEGLESAWKRKDGTLLWIRENARTVRDEDGKILYYEGTVEDITERKLAESERENLQEQLLQAQKMESVGRLAGGVAHDYNNMLGVILGRTEMVLSKMDKDDPNRGSMEAIMRAGKRSADLTRQLLAFARKQTIQPRVMNLNATIETMLKMLRQIIGENIDLSWQPGRDLWTVEMDPVQIDQILANLCVNARDALPSPHFFRPPPEKWMANQTKAVE